MGVDIPLEKPPIPTTPPKPIKPSSEKGFIMVDNSYSSGNPSDRPEGIEIRTGADNANALKDLEARQNVINKPDKKNPLEIHEDDVAEWFEDMFKSGDSYSEAYRIRPDGTFDTTRLDGKPITLVGFGLTPEKFYQTASEIQKKHPDWHFEFDVDPSTQRFKYTVTKVKPENK
jgi:hypothetical protein